MIFPITMKEAEYLKCVNEARLAELNHIKAMLNINFSDLPNGAIGIIQTRIDEVEDKLKGLSNE